MNPFGAALPMPVAVPPMMGPPATMELPQGTGATGLPAFAAPEFAYSPTPLPFNWPMPAPSTPPPPAPVWGPDVAQFVMQLAQQAATAGMQGGGPPPPQFTSPASYSGPYYAPPPTYSGSHYASPAPPPSPGSAHARWSLEHPSYPVKTQKPAALPPEGTPGPSTGSYEDLPVTGPPKKRTAPKRPAPSRQYLPVMQGFERNPPPGWRPDPPWAPNEEGNVRRFTEWKTVHDWLTGRRSDPTPAPKRPVYKPPAPPPLRFDPVVPLSTRLERPVYGPPAPPPAPMVNPFMQFQPMQAGKRQKAYAPNEEGNVRRFTEWQKARKTKNK